MITLVSKVQYQSFEEGEFKDIEYRSLPETWQFIQQFPWEDQRNNFVVKLTSPSVTIEQNDNSYLKIGMYHYGKFIAYYLNKRSKLFFVIFDELSEIETLVKLFFENKIQEIKWRKYFEWVFYKKKHFVTNTFEYKLKLASMLRLQSLDLICLAFLLVIGVSHIPIMENVSCLLIFYLVFFGVNWLLFCNYYFFTQKQYLQISRCNDEFYFGKAGSIVCYNKKDIDNIVTISNSGIRIPWGNYYLFIIKFKNGTSIKFTNMLIDAFSFDFKFPNHCICQQSKYIPFVKY